MPKTSTADWIVWHRRRLMRHTPKTSTANWIVWHRRRLMGLTPKTSTANWIVWHRRRLMRHTPKTSTADWIVWNTPKTSTADWIVWHRRRLMGHTPKTLVPVTHRRTRYQGHCKEIRSRNPWTNRERSGASGFEDKCGRDLSEGMGSFPCGRPDARQVTGSNTKGILERAAAGCNRKAPSVTWHGAICTDAYRITVQCQE